MPTWYYHVAVAVATTYSILAVVLLIVYWFFKGADGTAATTENINRLARTKTIIAFEVLSWSALGVWFLLVIPWVDLFTIQKFTHFKDGGIDTYFGWMDGHQADVYFVAMFLNILGAKAAITLAELAGLLRRGRVRVLRYGFFWVWMPAE